MYQLLTPTWQILSEEMQRKALANACRRGNAETEMLLMPYVSKLSNADERALFARLLEHDEQILFEWLMKVNTSPREFQALVESIRKNFLENHF